MEATVLAVGMTGFLSSLNHLMPLLPRLHDDPVLLVRLEVALFKMKNIMQFISSSQVKLSPELAALMLAIFTNSEESIKRSEKLLDKYKPQGGSASTGSLSTGRASTKRLRIQWAFRDKEAMKSILKNIEDNIRNLTDILDSFQSQLQLESISGTTSLLQDSASALTPADCLVVVMGPTGAGKSSFIQKATGSMTITIGHTLRSETINITPYSVVIGGRTVTLIDTPGFDDTELTDAEVLSEVASWMAYTYSEGYQLSSILYLTPITANRMSGTTQLNLDIFEKLVGESSFAKVTFVTTMWDLLQDISTGMAREEELKERFWGNLLAAGSRAARSFGDQKSALAIISTAISSEDHVPSSVPLAIQREIIEEQKPLAVTAAGSALATRLEALETMYNNQMQQFQDQINRLENVNALQQKQNQDLQEQINTLHQGVQILNDPQMTAPWPDQVEQTVSVKVRAHLTIGEILTEELPPPYSPRTWMVVFRQKYEAILNISSSVVDLLYFSLTPVFAITYVFQKALKRISQPKLKEGFFRVEWTCECGDFLIDDFQEDAAGSLVKLVRELNGKIVSGPGASERPITSAPLLTSVNQATTEASDNLDFGQGHSISSTPQHGEGNDSSVRHRDSGTAIVDIPVFTDRLWLELCIRSSAETHDLVELNIAGRQGDRTVFWKIREIYNLRRRPYIFGILKARRSKGGLFVQFLRDEISHLTSEATASISQRDCMPSEAEAREFGYKFHPTPMNGRPMSAETFHHYFKKPHKAVTESKWLDRFPKLNGPSLKNSAAQLPQGWGIEIVEARNWEVFMFVNAFILLLSGIIAVVIAIVSGNNSLAVAIGALLATVQGIVINTILHRWTDV